MVGLLVNREFAVGDAVPVPPHECSKVRLILLIARQVVEAEHDVGELARLVRDAEGNDLPAEIGCLHLHTMRVGDGVDVDRLPILGGAKGSLADFWLLLGGSRNGQNNRADDEGQQQRWIAHVTSMKFETLSVAGWHYMTPSGFMLKRAQLSTSYVPISKRLCVARFSDCGEVGVRHP